MEILAQELSVRRFSLFFFHLKTILLYIFQIYYA